MVPSMLRLVTYVTVASRGALITEENKSQGWRH